MQLPFAPWRRTELLKFEFVKVVEELTDIVKK
jgi:hypothetical protein